MVNLLRVQKYGHMRHKPFFFKTITRGDNTSCYLGERTLPLTIHVLFFIFQFYDQMDTCMGIHWGANCLEGEGCCDHAHPGRGVIMLASQRSYGVCPRPVENQARLQEMIYH